MFLNAEVGMPIAEVLKEEIFNYPPGFKTI
jgi:hypothetical protein